MASRYLIGDTTLPTAGVVPEGLKKKVERNAGLLAKKVAAQKEASAAQKVLRKGMKMRASKYEKQYKLEQKQLIAMRRQAKLTGNFFVEPEAKMMMVIRITGINKMAPKPRKILKLLRLDQLYKATFVKRTGPMMNMLKPIMPYVIMGNPNLKTVKNLILKKGFAKINGQRIPINDTQVISGVLGKFGIHSLDDLVHEIYTVGPNFKQANNFLWAFKLSSPNGGFVLKKHGYMEPKGGDWGDREEMINELVRRMGAQ